MRGGLFPQDAAGEREKTTGGKDQKKEREERRVPSETGEVGKKKTCIVNDGWGADHGSKFGWEKLRGGKNLLGGREDAEQGTFECKIEKGTKSGGGGAGIPERESGGRMFFL